MRKITLQFIAIACLLIIGNISSFAQYNFTASPNQGCGPLTVSFTNTTTDTAAYRFEWNYGDGSPMFRDTIPKALGSNKTHTHVFTNLGYYNVWINVYNNRNNYIGYSYGSSGNIQVNGTSFNSPDSTCKNDIVSFCGNGNGGNSNSYSWNFGDGNTASGNNCVDHSYASNGTYTVTLTADMGCGNQTATRKVIVANTVYPHPNAWTFSSTSCPSVPINFNTNGYASYSWNFGDPGSGANNTSTQQNPLHTYASVGNYSATLTVTNNCGKTGSATTTVSIINNPPFPNQSWFNLQVNSSPSCPNSNVGFNAPNGYASYLWNYGDGSPPVTTTGGNNNYSNHTYGSTLTTYTVSVKVHSACGNDSTLYNTLVINNTGHFPTQNFQLQVNSPACPNSSVGLNAPNGYVSYEWNFGDGSPVVTTLGNNNGTDHFYGSALTTYTVSVKITNGCAKDTTIYSTLKIKNGVGFPNQNFQLNTGPNPACPTDHVNWNAPSGYTNYLWDFGDGSTANGSDNNGTHSYISAGTYNGSVKITNACGKDTTIYGSVVVNTTGSFPNYLQINVTPNTGSCANDLIEFQMNQSGFQSYKWNFGDGSPLITTTVEKSQHSYTSTGTYVVTCTIKNGCSNTALITSSVQVTTSSPVSSSLTISGVQNPSCMNDKVFFVVNQGQSSYKYIWNYGDGSPATDTTIGSGSSHTYTTVGTYTVTVKVTNGCGMTKNVSFTQNVTTTAVPTLTSGDGSKNWGFPGSDNNGSSSTAGCSGDAIIFYFMGSAPNNLWDFGDGNTGTATESMLVYGGDGAFPVTIIKHSYAANGPYKVKLRITNNCGNSVTDSMNISIGGSQLVNGDMTTSPPPFSTCASINFLAFGGSTYGWNFGDGGSTLTTTSPTVSHTFSTKGIYTVSVLVTNGCGNTATYSRSVDVNGVGGPAVTLTSSAGPTCVNSTDGTATVSVTSGQPPYIYSWNNVSAQATATATGLSAGLYNATVTDNMGCKSVLAVSISNPAPIVLQVSTTTTSCGGSTGTASVSTSSGGTSPFTYQWSTGATGASLNGLSAGAYSVTATDFKGCTSFANVSISETGGAALSINSSTNVSCNGNSTGAIDINVTGGTAPYHYLWSNGSTNQDLTGLSSGNYSVLVTDNANCKASLNKTITQPTQLVAATSITTPPTCGNFDGTASATGTGGTGPYTYLWDPGAGTNKTTQSVSGLPAGSYTVTVTDSKGCVMDGTVSLSNSNAPNITAVVTDVSCNGGSNGGIDITVSGGTSPYLYTWNVAPPNTQDKTNLIAGTYMVFVNDSKGCMSFRSYTVAQPAVLTTSVVTTGATCSSNNGTASANPLGGNIPYSYIWTGAKTTQAINGLSVGSYTVTVTDNKGCTAKATSSIAVTVPTPNICMVTVDDLSINNIIYWDKTSYTNIDSFIVYREVSSGVYKRIAAQKDTALSQYIDVNRSVGPANGDPNVGAYRYKLQVRDACGNYSALSPYHNTIYIIDAGSGQFTWSLPYTVEGGANPVANYDLMCDLANANSWFSTGTVAGTQPSATDPGFATRPGTARWRVETIWSITCTPTRSSINTTRSNIKSSAASTSIIDKTGSGMEILVNPNPASDMVMIQYPVGYKKYQLQIVNALGQIVYNEQLGADGAYKGMITKQIDVSAFKKGIYIINIQTEYGNTFKRLAIQ